MSALGFIRTDWFISIGYGFSIAAEAVLFALLYLARYRSGPSRNCCCSPLMACGSADIWSSANAARPSAASSRRRGSGAARIAGPVKLAIWISVALLYVAMASPALFNLVAASSGAASWSLPLGVIVMLPGW